MSAFKKIPELDWLKDLAEDLINGAEEKAEAGGATSECDEIYEQGKRLDNLYRYLLWSRRYQLVAPTSDEGKVALGLLTKYHRRIYPVPLSDYEKKMIKQAEAGFKYLKEKNRQ